MGKYPCYNLSALPLLPVSRRFEDYVLIKNSLNFIHVIRFNDCKKALCASGTITLELAMLEIPMVIMYKLSYFSYVIMKSMINVKYIGLVNLILGNSIGSQPIVKEFIQPSYSDQVDIMVELNKIDQDREYRQSIIENYKMVKNKLSVESEVKLAELAERMLTPT